MKIYLSKYWWLNSFIMIFLIVFIVIGAVIFCAWSRDREDYIVILCAASWVLVAIGILFLTKRLLAYTIVGENQIKEFSVFSKELCTVKTSDAVYYEILPLIVGVFCTEKFIVLSDAPFASYHYRGFFRLLELCKYIDKNGSQIILPYNNGQIINQFGSSKLHRIG